MLLITLGLLLWAGVHFIPSAAIPLKQKWSERLGPNGYQGSFALLIVLSIVLIVIGWRSTVPEVLYVLPPFTRHLAMLIMLIAFILMGASHAKTRIKQYVRHPQLTGVVVWAFGHLLANGDSRSLLLFGGLGIWALINMQTINKRDGEWVKPDIPPIGVELRGLAISLVVYVVVVFLHPWISGMPLH
ncbi:MAG: NnrU family protein [Granulosicoccaceae bacterium]